MKFSSRLSCSKVGDSDAEDDEDEAPESPGSSSSVIDDGDEMTDTVVDGDDWVSDGTEDN